MEGTDQWEDRGRPMGSLRWRRRPGGHMLPAQGPHTARSSSVSCPSSGDSETRPENCKNVVEGTRVPEDHSHLDCVLGKVEFICQLTPLGPADVVLLDKLLLQPPDLFSREGRPAQRKEVPVTILRGLAGSIQSTQIGRAHV